MSELAKVIAVDFDGTLHSGEWPEIGPARDIVLCRALHEQNNGAKLILWTCRAGAQLAEAVAWCRERGLEFDAVNENLPEHVALFGGDTRKVFAHEYWEDKALCVRALEGGKI